MGRFNIGVLWRPFFYWLLIFGAYVVIRISNLSLTIKSIAGNTVESLFVLTLAWVAVTLSISFITYYMSKASQSLVLLTVNVIKAVVAAIALLIVLDIWGAPTEPAAIFLMFLVVGVFIAWLILKDTIPNLGAGLEILLGGQIKVGNIIKLESGETGMVCHVSWTSTTVKTPDGTMLFIPNKKLALGILLNYGRNAPIKTIPWSTNSLDALSDREREVLICIKEGASNREIAQKLVLSEHTVKSHLRSILRKLNISNRQQAAAYAEREGLVSGQTSAVKNDSPPPL